MPNQFLHLRAFLLLLVLMGGWTICALASNVYTAEDSMFLHPNNSHDEIELLVPTKIVTNHDDNSSTESYLRQTDNERSLQLLCSVADYQYFVQIRDDLKMSYTVLNDLIKIEMAYNSDDGWVGLGTNPSRSGKMVGAEAWVGLPDIASVPVIYNLNSKLISGILPSTQQTLKEGKVIQEGNGQTIVRFEKLLSDGINVPIDGDSEIVFIWAIGRTNTFAKHRVRGAFRIKLETCSGSPPSEPEEVQASAVCGLLGLSILCPITRCGIFGRTLGLCSL